MWWQATKRSLEIHSQTDDLEWTKRYWAEVFWQVTAHYGLRSRLQLIEWLNSLQPVCNEQWSSYRSSHVKIDYSLSQQQACYLLRSFVPYTQFVVRSLKGVAKKTDFELKTLQHFQSIILLGGNSLE